MKRELGTIGTERLHEMEAERIVCWSPMRQLWCVCNGMAKVIATAETKEEAERLKHYRPAEQLFLF